LIAPLGDGSGKYRSLPTRVIVHSPPRRLESEGLHVCGNAFDRISPRTPMSSTSTAPKAAPPANRTRPKYYDLNLLNLPIPGLVSIFHRITGVVMFLALIPATLFLLQCTLASESGFDQWKGYFALPAVKLIVLGFVWAYFHHLFAGIRYLLLDIHVGIAKEPAQASAKWVLIAGVIATVLFGARIW
jgi:succinate dehydrogenase / fumarate reductase cytochrome b subunit